MNKQTTPAPQSSPFPLPLLEPDFPATYLKSGCSISFKLGLRGPVVVWRCLPGAEQSPGTVVPCLTWPCCWLIAVIAISRIPLGGEAINRYLSIRSAALCSFAGPFAECLRLGGKGER